MLVAARIDRDGNRRDVPASDDVFADLDIPGAADEDRAVGLDMEELAGPKQIAAHKCLADRIAGDPGAVGIADEDRVDVGIVDVIALDDDAPVLDRKSVV